MNQKLVPFQLKSLRESNLQLIPADLKEYLKMLMSATPALRPDAAQFAKIGYFDDIGVKTLNNLDTQFQWDNLQKSQFYKVQCPSQHNFNRIYDTVITGYCYGIGVSSVSP